MHTLKSKKTAIQAFLYFMATAVVIAYFFPREGKFRYSSTRVSLGATAC